MAERALVKTSVEAAAMVTAEARAMAAVMAAANAAAAALMTAVAAAMTKKASDSCVEGTCVVDAAAGGDNHVDDGGESGSKVRVAVIAAVNAIAMQR